MILLGRHIIFSDNDPRVLKGSPVRDEQSLLQTFTDP